MASSMALIYSRNLLDGRAIGGFMGERATYLKTHIYIQCTYLIQSKKKWRMPVFKQTETSAGTYPQTTL